MAEHGGNLDEAARAFGFALDEMRDLSTGISPVSYEMALPSSSVAQALPLDSDLAALYEVAKTAYGAPAEAAICAGPGSQSLLGALPRLLAGPRVIWCPEPTYNEHRYRWEKYGHHVDGGPACPARADVIILGQPNNPNGHIWSKEEIASYHQMMQQTGGLLILDEAFADAMPEISFGAKAGQDGLIILRSLGKFYGLAGLRVGFALGADDMIAQLRDEIGPWPLSQLAMIVAEAALQDSHWQARHRDFLSQQARLMTSYLSKAGFEIVTSLPLFISVRHQHMPRIHHYLASHGFWTRRYQADPCFMRLGIIGDDADMAAFASLIEKGVATDWSK